MFFDVGVFKSFVKECRLKNINVPIVPGIMSLNTYPGFQKMVSFCKSRVPLSLKSKMETSKDDVEAIKRVGVELGVSMSHELLEFGVEGLHFYTLNLEQVTMGIIDALAIRSASSIHSEEAPSVDAPVPPVPIAASAFLPSPP